MRSFTCERSDENSARAMREVHPGHGGNEGENGSDDAYSPISGLHSSSSSSSSAATATGAGSSKRKADVTDLSEGEIGSRKVPHVDKGVLCRKVNAKANAWKHFKFFAHANNIVKCDHCIAEFQTKDGSTTSMNSHLKNKHPEIGTDEKVAFAKANMNQTKINFATKRTSFDTYPDKALDWMIYDYMPLSAVETGPFRAMQKSLRSDAPDLSNKRMKDMLKDKAVNCRVILDDLLSKQAIALTTDAWTSKVVTVLVIVTAIIIVIVLLLSLWTT